MLNKLTIKKKLFFLALLPIVSIVLVITIGLLKLQNADESVDRIYEGRVIPLRDLKVIADNYAVYVIDAINKANAGLMDAQEALAGVKEARKVINQEWDNYYQNISTIEEKALADETYTFFKPANADLDQLEAFLSPLSGNQAGKLDSFDGPLYQSIDPIGEKITSLINYQLAIAEQERTIIHNNYTNSLIIFTVLGLLLLAILVLTSYAIARSINKPLTAIEKSLNTVINDRDLRIRIETHGNDELTAISSSFNKMLARQSSLIADIRQASTSVTNAANQMSEITNQSNTSINQQQYEVEQVVSAMNQMVLSYREVTSSAGNADRETKSVLDKTLQSNTIVSDAIHSTDLMLNNVEEVSNRIATVEEDSRNIGSVVDVINSIAEQTNLLALNAAIEAARAGDQGRGFAVVADEVRTLAQRTQVSTTEIHDAVQRLQEGTKRAVESMKQNETNASHTKDKALEAGKALKNIADSIQVITEMNANIASASEEQSSVSEDINRSLVSISQVSQASVSNASAILDDTSQLITLSNELNDKISLFKV
ncbi:HAMP domain-containing methyl-accepting chemotaxis protein [Neptunomonas phycophila]|uniref:HAMP domain-containing methyl-accepting chemotaxis protein n=1 Tax=Neptunomonas phycophila TaxID=1572645 RepID=A0ABT9EV22_9GAMM|nr:HAMP domain-containing methyl-accepting chemotaxis protein [Neptunomonas phycophila]MDO6469346.1 HAMP domain-containing methyl-accepting chemotaxis protein [Neptunomonas phycophila]MDP2522911.1 HAMP domain-containing methyl-accepting chemotaxis protein [Neptunomonas phycophila]